MKKILLIILLSGLNTYAQTDSLTIDSIELKYKTFKYTEVLSLSEKLLALQQNLPKNELIKLLEMRAIAFFSLGKTDSSFNTFFEILNIAPDYKLNPMKTSPKIISFFEEVHNQFLLKQEDSIRSQQTLDSLTAVIQTETYNQFRRSMIRSIFVPGWGHLSAGYTTKGWILTTLGVGTLGGAIYYSIETNSKEKDYLNETNRELIESKYQKYNSTYKSRNILIAAYAAIWLYSQIDLIYLSKKSRRIKITSNIRPSLERNLLSSLSIQLKIFL